MLVLMAATDQTISEQRVLREACGLLDRSERGKLAFTGDEAQEFLNGQVSNDVLALAPGQGCYAALLTPKGKMLADLRIIRLPPPHEQELWLDTERGALQALFDSLRSHLVGYRVELHKRTLEQGLLSLIGPGAGAVLGQPVPTPEHAARPETVAGCPVLAVATDVGVDIVCAAEDLAEVVEALREGGATPVSEASAEVIRVERGRPRFGVDIDDSTIPQEAGLNDRAVSFTKGCYVGQETVARLYYRGKPNRELRGLMLSAVAASGDELQLGDRPVGRLGSVVRSSELGPIGLALVRREAGSGALLDVGRDGVRATVVELPFAATAAGPR
ncbi:MAG TPA: folate-binding protein [Solirubrobacteraceae bacterium]|jgi:folate-binding protein YgfZ|nr:folate-binding protein [Solirubrobacteraceae bacterium]